MNSPQAQPTPVRSMTGFAMVRQPTATGELTVTLRSVNHRSLDLHFQHQGELAQFENAMRALLKQNIARGHIEIRLTLVHDREQDGVYNQELLKRYVEAFRHASEDLSLHNEPDLNAFFTLPGVFEASHDTKSLDKNFETEILRALSACIDELNEYREREAGELCLGFEQEIRSIEQRTAQIGAIRGEALPHFVRRLQERLTDLLEGSNVSESRLIEEAALLADRSDVQEELARLGVHSRELRRILEGGGEIGKRVDFLLQEMNRETNTVLSKTSGIGEAGLTITNLALDIKANIERMREQALNLE